ncbi:sensor histidine kinase [Deinococcus lacus]|uniref:histidine kinase n=1 Tax=Deinococcus lacus TaxID=392561 RepID=A0ABW1YEE3_9DEIO
MKLRRFRGLRWRLTGFYTALFSLLLGAVSFTTQHLMHSDLLRSLDTDLKDTHRQLVERFEELDFGVPVSQAEMGPKPQGQATNLTPARVRFPNAALQVEPLPFFDRFSLSRQWDTAQKSGQGPELLQFVRLVAGELRLRPVGIDPAQPVGLTDEELIHLLEAPDGQILVEKQVQQQFSGTEPMRILVTLEALPMDGGAFGVSDETLAITYIGRSLTPLNTTVSRMQLVLWALFLLGAGVAGVGAYWLAGRALGPLQRVRLAVERIHSDNLTEGVPVPTSEDEVRALAEAFNGMLRRLQASFEAQRRFTSDASHELRTPVTAISGHATYLLRRTELTQTQRESIQIIQKETERLGALIASLLELARSDSGVLTLKLQPVFSQMLLYEISRELAPLAQAQQTELTVAGTEVAFEGDPDKLRQVIINLVSNALKAGSTRITLESHLVPGNPAPEVRLSVRDNGPGIEARELQRLFDRFYRLEDSRSRDQGAGLGLSIAKGIVDAHQGRIWLESTVGTGTTAHVQLPLGDIPELGEDDVP